ncbi:MAG: HAMP domain-containing histidine kinase [Bacteroidales bacterium]|nr:HAMP domain-containing histidine kinase [Bacteroidales bacterium]
MSKKHDSNTLQTLLAIITIGALLMLLFIQVSWIIKVAKIEEQQFNDKAAYTMKQVKHELHKRASTCSNMKDYLSGKKCPSTIQKEKIEEIDSIVQCHLNHQNIWIEYNFSIGDSLMAAEKQKINKTYCYLEKLNGIIEKDGIRICMEFPTRNQFIIAQMKGWFIVSILFILFLATTFFILMRMLTKEKAMLIRTTDFINNIVHEFQTPIANIKFASNLIKKRNNNTDYKTDKYTTVINDETDKLESNVERILNLSCPTKATNIEQVNINNIINNVLLDYNYKITECNCQIIKLLNASNTPLKGDKSHFHLLFSNLIDNALKYSKKPSKIIIETQSESKQLSIRLQDNGIGINKNDIPFIFDKYYRVSTGNVHNVKGFGLGLTYVKKIIDIYNGTIKVNSQINKGTEFIIKFPY